MSKRHRPRPTHRGGAHVPAPHLLSAAPAAHGRTVPGVHGPDQPGRVSAAGPEPARPWWHYLDAHNADPEHYPATRAIADFEAQPRIAAMVAAPTTDAGQRFMPDMYGPGLEALHTAGPNIYADYQSGLLT